MKDETSNVIGGESGRHDRSNPPILMPSLLDAIARGERTEVALLLDAHPSQLHSVFSRVVPDQLLHVAASSGDVPLVEMLVCRGADVNARGDGGATPLHAAAQRGHVGVAALLIRLGADARAKDLAGDTPLSLAAHSRSDVGREAVDPLVALGIPLDLSSALALGKVDDARRLLATGPDAVRDAPVPGRLLSDAIIMIQSRIWQRTDPLDLDLAEVDAVVAEHIDILDSLLAFGAPMDQDYRALPMALGMDHPAVAERLLETGTDTRDGPDLWAAADNSRCRDRMFDLLRRYGVHRDNKPREADDDRDGT